MTENKKRYFIELQLDAAQEVPRHREAEIRRAQAAHFIDQIAGWLHDEALKDKVSAMAITALGQVQITCEQDVITRLRSDDSMHIAAIRRATLAASVYRIGAR